MPLFTASFYSLSYSLTTEILLTYNGLRIVNSTGGDPILHTEMYTGHGDFYA